MCGVELLKDGQRTKDLMSEIHAVSNVWRAMCAVELLKDRQRIKDLMSERFML